ncbi:MAG: metal-dependent hydrolase [Anaerolineaceae bacterium]|nr:metal-dependent hydrolase [Anaerolineaceae bacterium]
MMSKTHIAVGLAASLAAAPATKEGLSYALMGGAIGSLICDIDRSSERPSRDVKQGWGISLTVFFVAFMHRSYAYWQTFKAENILSNPLLLVCLGLLAVLLLFAINGAHRGFSHSLLMCAASAFLIYFISKQTCLFYITGFLTHLLLDVLNKKPVRVFYPAKGICLGWFYADGLANSIILLLGCAADAAILMLKFQVYGNILNVIR